MSDFGMFEASVSSESEQQHQQREAAVKLDAAIYDVKQRFGGFLFGAATVEEYHDRLALCKNDVIKTVEPHLFPRTGVLRRVLKPIEREFKARIASERPAGEEVADDDPVDFRVTPDPHAALLPHYGSQDPWGDEEKRLREEHYDSEDLPGSASQHTAGNPHPVGDPAWFRHEYGEGDPASYGPHDSGAPGGGIPLRGPLSPEQEEWMTRGRPPRGSGGVNIRDLHRAQRLAWDDYPSQEEEGGQFLNFAHPPTSDAQESPEAKFRKRLNQGYRVATDGPADPMGGFTPYDSAAMSRIEQGSPAMSAWADNSPIKEGYLKWCQRTGSTPTQEGFRRFAGDGNQKELKTEQTFKPSKGDLKPKGDFKGYLDRVDQNARNKVDVNFDGKWPGGEEHDRDPADSLFAPFKKAEVAKFANWCRTAKVRPTLAALDHYNPPDHVYAVIVSALQRQAGEGEVVDPAGGIGSWNNPGTQLGAEGGTDGVQSIDSVGNHWASRRQAYDELGSGYPGLDASPPVINDPAAPPRKKPRRPANEQWPDQQRVKQAAPDYRAVVDDNDPRTWVPMDEGDDSPEMAFLEDQHSRGVRPGKGRPNPKRSPGDEGPGGYYASRRQAEGNGFDAFGSGSGFTPFNGGTGWDAYGRDDHPAAPGMSQGIGDGLAKSAAGQTNYLQKADQALTDLLNQKAEEFQTSIQALQQALVTVQQAEQAEQAMNPLNVVPGGNGINVLPQPQGAAGVQAPGMDASQVAGAAAPGGDPNAGAAPPDGGQGAPPPAAGAQGALPPDLQQMQARRKRGGQGKGKARSAGTRHADVVGEWNNWLENRAGQGALPSGLPNGSEADLDQFVQEKGIGDRAKGKLRQQVFGDKREACWPGCHENEAHAKKYHKDKEAVRQPEFVERERTHSPAQEAGVSEEEYGDARYDAFEHDTPRRKGSRKQAWFGWGPDPRHRKVAGWDWDPHLAAYVTSSVDRFACDCGEEHDTPKFHRCKCGKQWNSYVIGRDGEGRQASLEKVLCREIPVRRDVIVASKTAKPHVDKYAPIHEDPPGDWFDDSDPVDFENSRNYDRMRARHKGDERYAFSDGPHTEEQEREWRGSKEGRDWDRAVRHQGDYTETHWNRMAAEGGGNPYYHPSTVDPSKMWNNFNELSVGHGADPQARAPQQQRPMAGDDHPADAAKYMGPQHWAKADYDADIDTDLSRPVPPEYGGPEPEHHHLWPHRRGGRDDYSDSAFYDTPDADAYGEGTSHGPPAYEDAVNLDRAHPKGRATPKDWHRRDRDNKWAKRVRIDNPEDFEGTDDDAVPPLKSTPKDWHRRDQNQRWTK